MEEQYINIDAEEDANQKELIEQDLDSKPDDNPLDLFIRDIKEPEVLPSCLDYRDWLANRINEEYQSDTSRLMELELLAENIQSQIDEIKERFRQEYNNIYIRNYRKQLREWWINRKNSKLNG